MALYHKSARDLNIRCTYICTFIHKVYIICLSFIAVGHYFTWEGLGKPHISSTFNMLRIT